MTSKISKTPKNKTQKNPTIQGEILEKKEGWISIHIYGEPYERGYAHGYLLANELKRAKKVLKFLVETEIHVKYSKYAKASKNLIYPIIEKQYPEFHDELRGICDGAHRAGAHNISMEFLVEQNAYMTLYQYFEGVTAERCSAFIACGDATEDGKIVMAHNTHTDFASGQLFNISMKVTPTKGYEFVMQASPGLIASSTDWFITKAGIVGCETTISSTNYDIKLGVPYFLRIRQAMQYGKSLEDYANIMVKNNAGDYPCSWQFGDINTNQIMLLELGLKYHNKIIKNSGLFYGMNSAMGFKLRKLETTDRDNVNVEDSSGARNARLNYLLYDKYYGKLNAKNAKTIISDHYDTLHHKPLMEGRCVCIHYENDEWYDYCFAGCTDGKILTSSMAEKMQYEGRFGSSCGRELNIKEHIRKHPQHKKWGKVLENFKNYKWVKL